MLCLCNKHRALWMKNPFSPGICFSTSFIKNLLKWQSTHQLQINVLKSSSDFTFSFAATTTTTTTEGQHGHLQNRDGQTRRECLECGEQVLRMVWRWPRRLRSRRSQEGCRGLSGECGNVSSFLLTLKFWLGWTSIYETLWVIYASIHLFINASLYSFIYPSASIHSSIHSHMHTFINASVRPAPQGERLHLWRGPHQRSEAGHQDPVLHPRRSRPPLDPRLQTLETQREDVRGTPGSQQVGNGCQARRRPGTWSKFWIGGGLGLG